MPLTEPPPWLTHRTYRDVPYYAGIADYVALWVHSRRRLAKAELTLQPVRSLAQIACGAGVVPFGIDHTL